MIIVGTQESEILRKREGPSGKTMEALVIYSLTINQAIKYST
jgi:hypothetical protein